MTSNEIFNTNIQSTTIYNPVVDIIYKIPNTDASAVAVVDYRSLNGQFVSQSGTYNTRLGSNSLNGASGECSFSTCVGSSSLNIPSENSTVVGTASLGTFRNNIVPNFQNNVAMGYNNYNIIVSDSFDNVSIGFESAQGYKYLDSPFILESKYNLNIGDSANWSAITPEKSVIIGSKANALNDDTNTQGDINSVIIGAYNGYTYGSSVGIGTGSNYSHFDGNRTTVLGINSLVFNNYHFNGSGGVDVSNSNTILGNNVCPENSTTYENICIGNDIFSEGSDKSKNICIGHRSSYSYIRSPNYDEYNVCIGTESLYNGGNKCIAIGHNSMKNTGSTNVTSNVSVGLNSLQSNQTGSYNVALGHNSSKNLISGDRNTCLGYETMYNTMTGSDNSCLGYQSLFNLINGDGNTAFGKQTLYNLVSGNYNTAFGALAGSNLITGNNNSFFGYNAQPSVADVKNEITLGDSNVTSLYCAVSAISSLSDKRDKTDIENFDDGIEVIKRLNPVNFKWDKREWYQNNKSDGSKMKEEINIGLLAQELDVVQDQLDLEFLDLVYKGNPEKLEATYGNLIPCLVNTVKALSKIHDNLENKIRVLEASLVK